MKNVESTIDNRSEAELGEANQKRASPSPTVAFHPSPGLWMMKSEGGTRPFFAAPLSSTVALA